MADLEEQLLEEMGRVESASKSTSVEGDDRNVEEDMNQQDVSYEGTEVVEDGVNEPPEEPLDEPPKKKNVTTIEQVSKIIYLIVFSEIKTYCRDASVLVENLEGLKRPPRKQLWHQNLP